jgi:hypothetical protein
MHIMVRIGNLSRTSMFHQWSGCQLEIARLLGCSSISPSSFTPKDRYCLVVKGICDSGAVRPLVVTKQLLVFLLSLDESFFE